MRRNTNRTVRRNTNRKERRNTKRKEDDKSVYFGGVVTREERMAAKMKLRELKLDHVGTGEQLVQRLADYHAIGEAQGREAAQDDVFTPPTKPTKHPPVLTTQSPSLDDSDEGVELFESRPSFGVDSPLFKTPKQPEPQPQPETVPEQAPEPMPRSVERELPAVPPSIRDGALLRRSIHDALPPLPSPSIVKVSEAELVSAKEDVMSNFQCNEEYPICMDSNCYSSTGNPDPKENDCSRDNLKLDELLSSQAGRLRNEKAAEHKEANSLWAAIFGARAPMESFRLPTEQHVLNKNYCSKEYPICANTQGGNGKCYSSSGVPDPKDKKCTEPTIGVDKILKTAARVSELHKKLADLDAVKDLQPAGYAAILAREPELQRELAAATLPGATVLEENNNYTYQEQHVQEELQNTLKGWITVLNRHVELGGDNPAPAAINYLQDIVSTTERKLKDIEQAIENRFTDDISMIKTLSYQETVKERKRFLIADIGITTKYINQLKSTLADQNEHKKIHLGGSDKCDENYPICANTQGGNGKCYSSSGEPDPNDRKCIESNEQVEELLKVKAQRARSDQNSKYMMDIHTKLKNLHEELNEMYSVLLEQNFIKGREKEARRLGWGRVVMKAMREQLEEAKVIIPQREKLINDIKKDVESRFTHDISEAAKNTNLRDFKGTLETRKGILLKKIDDLTITINQIKQRWVTLMGVDKSVFWPEEEL